MSAEVLSIEQLRCSFSSVVAVDGVSLACEKGQITGVIGPNGAGKSTLLACVAGVTCAQSGKVWFQGRNVLGLPAYRVARLGIIRTFQIANVFPRMTVIENLLVGSELRASSLTNAIVGPRRWRDSENRSVDRARGFLRRFRLERLENRYAGELSGGERRLVEIIRALMASPRLLLLDEPMAGVNPSLVERFTTHLRELANEGLTMLMVEHELRYIDAICDKVIVMAQGRLVSTGTMEQIRADRDVLDVYLVG